MRQIRSVSTLVLSAPCSLAATIVGATCMILAQLAFAKTPRMALIASEAALLAPALALVMARRVDWPSSLGWTSIDLRVARLSVLAGLTFWLASLGLMELQSLLWKPDPRYLRSFQDLIAQLRPHGLPDALLSIVAIAISPAFFEESLCRGILLPSFGSRNRALTAVIGSAFVFGLLHLDLYRFFFTFTVGLGLGALRIRSGSTWSPFLAHATLNSITFACALSLSPSASMETTHPILSAFFLLSGATGSWWVILRMGRNPKPDSKARRR